MKTLAKIFTIIPVLFITLFTLSCNDDEDDKPTQTISQIASSEGLKTFLAAVEDLKTAGYPQLDEIINGLAFGGNPPPYTVFIPTDEAIADYLNDNGYTSLDQFDTALEYDALEDALLNHVLAGEFSQSYFKKNDYGYLETLAREPYTAIPAEGKEGNNIDMFFNGSAGSAITLNGGAVITASKRATNGWLHIVDKVIELPTVYTFIVADPAFSNPDNSVNSFKEAIDRIVELDGSESYIGVLNEPADAPYTLFIPNQDAFAAYLNGGFLSDTGLENFVDNHRVKQHYYILSDIDELSGGVMESANDETELSIGADSPSTYIITATTLDDLGNIQIVGSGNIVTSDIRAYNGVIHILDGVLWE